MPHACALDSEELRRESRRLATLAREASAEDTSLEVRGIVWLEHVNIVTGDRRQAEVFYFQGLGLTRDPVRDVGSTMWANVGPRQQLHLVDASEGNAAQAVDGSLGLALPDLPALLRRLASVEPALRGTRFAYADLGHCVVATCPWGNRFFVYPTAAAAAAEAPERPRKFPRTRMEEAHAGVDRGMAVRGEAGIRFVQWRCTDAAGAGRFYERIFGCCVRHSEGGSEAAVCVGPSVHLIFSTAPEPRDAEAVKLARGVHVCVYISEFKRVHDALKDEGLIWTNPRFADLDACDSYEEAVASRQFRFRSIREGKGGKELAELEHEVRALRHVQFMKHVYYVPK